MPAHAADPAWMERALRDYVTDKEAALEAAASRIGGADVVQGALDDWAYRIDDAHGVYQRTVFVWERLLSGQSITPDALDAAWRGQDIPPPDDAELAELLAASAMGEGIRNRLTALDEDDLDAAITAAGGMNQVQAAIARWTSDHDQSEAAAGVFLILHRVVAGQPIDHDSLEAAWHDR